jgi:hypothetical protein
MEEEIARLRLSAEQFVNGDQPGPIKVQELYGEGWDQVVNPTGVGKAWAKLVRNREIPGLEIVPLGERSNGVNHTEYRRR